MCRKILVLALAVSFLTVGCKTSSTNVAPPLAPGFTSQPDQVMFSTLKAAHDFYQVLQSDASSGKWTPSPTEKQTLNAFAITLNTAEAEYLAFKNGTATQAQAQAAVDKVSAAETQLQMIAPQPAPSPSIPRS